MQIFKRIIAAATLALIATAVVSGATVILLMFTKGTELGHHVGLFGSLFFDAHESGAGSVIVGMGVENPLVLTLIFAGIFAIFMIFLSILSALRKRKRFLEQRATNAD
ncbi:hypothetical protein [Arcanobacterium phocae]|uniref:hypothetical protein n=1 Tax=Arcanobacterium phocae TaxID=131112 RepID=UPI001C0F2B4B|nr:hypothetical protein [Arcanobacterium phocae]